MVLTWIKTFVSIQVTFGKPPEKRPRVLVVIHTNHFLNHSEKVVEYKIPFCIILIKTTFRLPPYNIAYYNQTERFATSKGVFLGQSRPLQVVLQKF